MRLKAILIIVMVLRLSSVNANLNGQIDSLKALIAIEQDDELLVTHYLDLVNLFYSQSRDSAFKYNELGYVKAKSIGLDASIARTKSNKALFLMQSGKSDSAAIILKGLLKKPEFLDTETIVNTYTNLGILNHYNSDYKVGLNYYQKALEVATENDILEEIPRLHYNIGDILSTNELYSGGYKHWIEALKTGKELGNNRIVAVTLHGLGTAYHLQEKMDSALIFHRQSLDYAERAQSPEALYRANWGLASVYDDLKEYKKALAYMLNAENLLKQLNAKEYLPYCHCLLGRIYSNLGQHKQSIEYFKEFDKSSKLINDPYRESKCYEYWATAFEKTGNYKEALKYSAISVAIKDSIFSNENRNNLAELQTKYETVQKDAEIQSQNFELEKNALTIKKKHSQTIALFSSLIFLLGILGISFYGYKQRLKLKEQRIKTVQKEQELNSFKAMIEGEEKERVRVARDLHDGIGALLGSLSMKMAGLKEENKTLETSKKFEEVINGIDNTAEEVRRISHNLMPAVLLQFGLVKALEDHFGRINQSNLMKVDFQHYGIDERLSQRVELIIYRIIQELINNIIKYAEAKNAIVQLNRNNETLALTIEDDGKGVNWSKQGNVSGIGIENLKSRIDAVKGEIDIDAKANIGTSVYIQIELEKTNAI